MEHIAGAYDVALADLTVEECIIGQAGLVAVRENMPLRPGRASSSLVVRLVLLALKTKAGLVVEADVFGDGLCTA